MGTKIQHAFGQEQATVMIKQKKKKKAAPTDNVTMQKSIPRTGVPTLGANRGDERSPQEYWSHRQEDAATEIQHAVGQEQATVMIKQKKKAAPTDKVTMQKSIPRTGVTTLDANLGAESPPQVDWSQEQEDAATEIQHAVGQEQATVMTKQKKNAAP